MSHSPDPDRNLERAVHQALRALPVRPAPRTLEQRVLGEIQRRAALPWWRNSFAHWPIAARGAFLVTCAGIAGFVVIGGGWAELVFDTPQVQAMFAEPLSWLENGLIVVHALTAFFDILVRNIPPLWVQGGLVLFAAMYVALCGLGAAAYKALHPQR